MPKAETVFEAQLPQEGVAEVRVMDTLGHEIARPDFTLEAYFEHWQEARRNGHVVPDHRLSATFKRARAGDVAAGVQLTEALSGYVALVASDYCEEHGDQRALFEFGRSVMDQFCEDFEPGRGRHLVGQLSARLVEAFEAYQPDTPEPVVLRSVPELEPEVEPELELEPTPESEHLHIEVPERQMDQRVQKKSSRKLKYRIVTKGSEEMVFDLATNRIITYESIATADRITPPKPVFLSSQLDEEEAAMFRKLANHRILSDAEEQFLLRRYQVGDREAMQIIMDHNYRLVMSLAHKIQRRRMTLSDRFQEGIPGLKRAIEKYNPDRHLKFSTYATWWIRQSIDRAVKDKGRTIRLPVHVAEQESKLRTAEDEFRIAHGFDPTDEELSQETGIKITQIAAIRAAANPASLDAEVGEGGDALGAFQADPKSEAPFVEFMDRDTLKILLRELDERSCKMIEAYYGIEGPTKTYEVIGRAYGVTRERARQIITKGVKQMADKARSGSRA